MSNYNQSKPLNPYANSLITYEAKLAYQNRILEYFGLPKVTKL